MAEQNESVTNASIQKKKSKKKKRKTVGKNEQELQETLKEEQEKHPQVIRSSVVATITLSSVHTYM